MLSEGKTNIDTINQMTQYLFELVKKNDNLNINLEDEKQLLLTVINQFLNDKIEDLVEFLQQTSLGLLVTNLYQNSKDVEIKEKLGELQKKLETQLYGVFFLGHK